MRCLWLGLSSSRHARESSGPIDQQQHQRQIIHLRRALAARSHEPQSLRMCAGRDLGPPSRRGCLAAPRCSSARKLRGPSSTLISARALAWGLPAAVAARAAGAPPALASCAPVRVHLEKVEAFLTAAISVFCFPPNVLALRKIEKKVEGWRSWPRCTVRRR